MITLNNQEVQFGKFPNKEGYLDFTELHFKIYNYIGWHFEEDAEFFKLALLKGHIDDAVCKAQLSISYMPHSRMDRVNNTYAFSLKTACKLVNDMGFVSVSVMEPHSDVTPALLNTCFQYDWCAEQMEDVIKDCGADSIFFPDAGAAKRYETELPYAVGIKRRDFKTGGIKGFDLIGDVGKVVLIVDDLTSKGGTFVHSSMALKKLGAEKVYLLVAHCETTVYKGTLFDHIEMLYTGKHNQGINASDVITLI